MLRENAGGRMLMALHTLALYGNGRGGGGGFRALLDKPGFIIGSAFFFSQPA